MKRILKYCSVVLMLLLAFMFTVKAESKTVYVNLETLEYSTDRKTYESIREYKTLEEFLVDYESNNLPSIYITDFLFDGVTITWLSKYCNSLG